MRREGRKRRPERRTAEGVLLGNGDGTFGDRLDYGTGSEPITAAMADLNGDGKLDLAVTDFGDDSVAVLINHSTDLSGIKPRTGDAGVAAFSLFAPAPNPFFASTSIAFSSRRRPPRHWKSSIPREDSCGS